MAAARASRPAAPVTDNDVPVAAPITGVTKVGEVANTLEPVPVSSVNKAAKLALDGVAKNVAAPVPSPETPVEIGKPVQLVKVPLDGVPNAPPLTKLPDAVPVSAAVIVPAVKLP